MPKVNYNVDKKPQKKLPEKVYCRKCQRDRSPNYFYETTNPMLDSNGLLSICVDCCNDLYQHYFQIYGNMRDAIFYTCRDLDVRFSDEALQHAQTHAEGLISRGKNADKMFGYYKSKICSTGKKNDKIYDLRFKDTKIDIYSDIKEDTHNENDNIDVNDNAVKYWGEGKDSWEYEFLEEELGRIQASFECPDYSMEMIMKDIAFLNLDAEKIRRGLLKADLLKTIEARSKLMNDANMKPVQSTGAEASDQVTFGTLIKRWENDKPIPVALDDEMKKYIDTFMVGHLAKMLNLNGDLTDKYQDSLKDFTIDFEAIDNEDDD